MDRGSRLSAAVLLPNSLTSDQPSGPQVPDVSIATGVKSTVARAVRIFARALFQQLPLLSLLPRCLPGDDKAQTSLGHAASQAMHRPRSHGTAVTPSGRFSLATHNPCGSRVARQPAPINARSRRSLTWL